jgi:hypothetical protein
MCLPEFELDRNKNILTRMTDPDSLKLLSDLNQPFWQKLDFWISFVLGALGLLASWMAFREAKNAKKAANEAGKTVKIQTITIELSEIIFKLDKLEPKIEFSEARDYYSEVNRRIKRLTAPFKSEEEYKEIIATIYETLEELQDSLSRVRPIDQQAQTPVENSIYFAVEKHFRDLGGQLAELMGSFEKRTLKKD